MQLDVLGIFGNNSCALSSRRLGGVQDGSAAGASTSEAGDGCGDGEPSVPKISAAVRWKQAKLVAQQQVLTKRWHKDVDRGYKRLWLGFKDSHTLLAGVFYRGSSGCVSVRGLVKVG